MLIETRTRHLDNALSGIDLRSGGGDLAKLITQQPLFTCKSAK